MKKIILTTGLFLASIFILVSILFSIVTNTDWATQKIVNLCQNHLEEFSYTSLQGKINGSLQIQNLHLKTAGVSVNIDKILLNTHVTLLRVNFKQIVAEGIRLKINKHVFEKKASKSKSFFMPALEFKQVRLTNLTTELFHTKKIHFQQIFAEASLRKNQYRLNIHDKDKQNILAFNSSSKKHSLRANLNVNRATINISGEGDSKHSHYAGTMSDQHQGSLNFHANISHAKKTLWWLTANANKLHVDDLYPGYWPGHLSFDVQGSNTAPLQSIVISQLSGKIEEQTINGDAKINLDEHGIKDITTQLHTDSANLHIQGMLIPYYNLAWQLDISDLNRFIPKTSGSIRSQGMLNVQDASQQIVGMLQIHNLNYFDAQIKNLSTQFRLNANNQHSGRIQLIADKLKLKNLSFDKLNANIEGQLTNHHLNVILLSKQQRLTLMLDGHWQDRMWQASLRQLEINLPQQNYYLGSTADFQLSTDHWEIANFCLKSNNGVSNFCLRAKGIKLQQMAGEVNARNFDLAIINPFLPEAYSLGGKANFIAHAQQNKPHIFERSLQADLSPGFVNHSDNNSNAQKWSYQNAKLDVSWNEKELRSNINMNLSPQANLRAEMSLPKFNLQRNMSSQPLKAEINWHTTALNFIESIIPYVKNMQGVLDAKINVAGVLKKPVLAIKAKLNDGSFTIPSLQIKPSAVNIEASGDQQLLTYHGSLNSADGKLVVEGKTNLDQPVSQTTLQLDGKNLLISNTSGIKIFANPQMNLKISKNDLYLDGTVQIPNASLQPTDFGNTETLSDDVVYVKDKKKSFDKTSFKVHSNLKLTLGENIYLNYRGIKGKVVGGLKITDDPNSATTATGQLGIENGTYTFRNNTLVIDYGRLNFSGGPINNPFLDIRASRTLQNINSNLLQTQVNPERVGIIAVGSLKQPKIQLFSEPPGKTQADILSYLILGVPSGEAKGANAEMLLQAADALNLGGTSNILNLKSQLQKSLGLSEMNIGTASETDPKTQKTTTHTSFVLGKYFSPKFYVNYSFDISNYTNTFKVRYLLNKYWILQSVTNTNGSGLDVLYVKEK